MASANNKTMYKIVFLTLLALIPFQFLYAIEIEGDLLITQYSGERVKHLPGGVSIALRPLEHVEHKEIASKSQGLLIKHNKASREFLTIRIGEPLEVSNFDAYEHKLVFKNRREEKVVHFLAFHEDQVPSKVSLVENGMWQAYCKYHKEFYVRIDIVDAAYIQHLPDSGQFKLPDLGEGTWRMRVATLFTPPLEKYIQINVGNPVLNVHVNIPRGRYSPLRDLDLRKPPIEKLLPSF